VTEPPILAVRNLSKRFDLRQSLSDFTSAWFSRGSKEAHTIWAVRDVSFEMPRGKIYGVIGVNGAGKSTLVKLITGALDPTEGSVEVSGQVISLPELGTDLNEDLTGRQNVLAGAKLLDLPRGYAEARLNEIQEFSELGAFFDHRVRTYSTGMRMRLAFSAFAFLDCDLLILDEVMAVGDIFFQQKCYQRIVQLIESGTSILLVTHDFNAIQHYCHEVIVLHQGEKVFQGSATDAIQAFVRLRGVQTARPVDAAFTKGSTDYLSDPIDLLWPKDESILLPPMGQAIAEQNAHITRMAFCDQQDRPINVFQQGQTATLYFEVEIHKNIGVPVAVLEISNQYNILIHSKNTIQSHTDVPLRVHAGQKLRFCQRVELGLEPADYVVSITLLTMHPDDYGRLDELTQQDFNERLTWVCQQHQAGAFIVTYGLNGGMALTHAGICDLPGQCQLYVVSDPATELPVAGAQLLHAAD
jgi:lipopolysaccharide transport system ATP-binding protein